MNVMNGTAEWRLGTVFNTCLRIIALRGSPEQLPYSRSLYYLALAVAAQIAIVNRILIPDVGLGHALLNTTGEFAILLGGLSLVLSSKGMKERYLKIACALLCISAVGEVSMLVLRLVGPNQIVQVLVIGVLVAQVTGFLRSITKGMDVAWYVALFFLFAYLWLILVFFGYSAAIIESTAAASGSA